MKTVDVLFDLTREALTKKCSPPQRTAFELVHGIDQHGATEPKRLEDTARQLGISRSAARWHLAIAEAIVYKHIAHYYIQRDYTRQLANAPGIPTSEYQPTYGMSVRERSKTAYTNITLGEGSEAVIKAARCGSAETRATRYQQIQTTYTREARHDA